MSNVKIKLLSKEKCHSCSNKEADVWEIGRLVLMICQRCAGHRGWCQFEQDMHDGKIDHKRADNNIKKSKSDKPTYDGEEWLWLQQMNNEQ